MLTLEELISLNRQGFDLDSLNDDVQQDARDVANMPYFRTTGMKVTVDLKYDNKMNGKAVANNNDIDATVDVEAAGGWAGAGPQVFFVQAPSYDADGARSAEKMIRYRQGVEVVFRASGLVYAFDTQHFMNTLLSAYLFLAFAVYVMDFVTFNLLPNGISKVLYAKRAELEIVYRYWYCEYEVPFSSKNPPVYRTIISGRHVCLDLGAACHNVSCPMSVAASHQRSHSAASPDSPSHTSSLYGSAPRARLTLRRTMRSTSASPSNISSTNSGSQWTNRVRRTSRSVPFSPSKNSTPPACVRLTIRSAPRSPL